ncbi:MAG: hypothetical protein E6G62_11980 [Actinobacteria bacterium]|nr:MAG: hypothetical protein E6G62_11980 [Actinomycetota bacterium]
MVRGGGGVVSWAGSDGVLASAAVLVSVVDGGGVEGNAVAGSVLSAPTSSSTTAACANGSVGVDPAWEVRATW